MNNQLIVKTIKYNNKSCPEIVYDNPLLDRTVARELAASFVKILRITDQNSNINSNLRHSILENIRKLCQNNAEDHFTINDVYIDMLNQFYNDQVSKVTNKKDAIDRKLDAYLRRKITGSDLALDHQSSLNAEVIQALLNLNKGGMYLDKLSSDIINWNGNDSKYINILKGLWSEDCQNTRVQYIDDVAIILKAEIEKQLLETSHKLLTNPASLDNTVTCNDSKSLINKCAVSKECFQTCCSTLNCLFIMTNYDKTLEVFIANFIQNVKSCLQEHEFSVLYPIHLQNTVLLLDIDPLQLGSMQCQEQYIDKSLGHLHKLHNNSKHDFILLLTHFPQWFDLYFNKTFPN